jgi:hypothetical protein
MAGPPGFAPTGGTEPESVPAPPPAAEAGPVGSPFGPTTAGKAAAAAAPAPAPPAANTSAAACPPADVAPGTPHEAGITDSAPAPATAPAPGKKDSPTAGAISIATCCRKSLRSFRMCPGAAKDIEPASNPKRLATPACNPASRPPVARKISTGSVIPKAACSSINC